MAENSTPTTTQPFPPRFLRSLFLTRKKRPGFLVWCALLFGLYAFGLGVALPYFAKPYLERILTRELNAACVIRHLTFNPFTLRISARDVTIPYPQIQGHRTDKDFVRLKRLELSPSLNSVAANALILNDVRLVAPEFHLVRFKDGSLSPQLFFASDNAGAAQDAVSGKTGDDGGLFPLVVRNITIRDGRLTFADAIFDTAYAVTDIDLSVPFISTLSSDKDRALTPTLSALYGGERIVIHGETRPFAATRQTLFTLRPVSVDLPAFRNYMAPYTGLTLESGSVRAGLTLRFTQNIETGFDLALTGKMDVENLKLADGRNLVASLPKASAEVENILLGPRRVSINGLSLENPEIVLRRNKKGAVDWQSFFFLPEDMPASDVTIASGQGAALPLPNLPEKKAGEPAGKPEGLPLLLTLKEARIRGGTITWHDAAPGAPVRFAMENVNGEFTDVSTEDQGRAFFNLGFRNGNAEFFAEGKATVSPMRADGSVKLVNMPLAPFKPYIPSDAGVDIEGGVISASGNLGLRYEPTPTARLTQGSLAIANMAARLPSLAGQESPLAVVRRIEASQITADTATRTLALGELSGTGIDVTLTRDKNGEIMLPTPTGGKMPADTPARTAETASPWKIDVHRVRIDKSGFSLTDMGHRRQPVLPLTDISITGKDFANHDNKRWTCTIAAKPGTRGTLSLSANGTLAPLDLTFSAVMDKADMRPLAPYIQEKSRITLVEATLGGDFEGRVRRVPDSARGAELNIKGNIGLYGITLVHKRKEIGGWGRMRIEGLEYQAPAAGCRHLRIGSVRVNNPRLAVTIDEAGVSTLMTAFQPPGKAASEPDAAQPAEAGPAGSTEPDFPLTSLDIGKISIALGQANYLDQRVTPPYALRVDKVNVELEGLSLDPKKNAALEGSLSINGSPVTVSGVFRSLLSSPSGNGKLDIRDLDLARFTQYSEKYLGYPVRRGELTLHTEASLKGRKLSMQNSMRISNLDLGKKAESPYAPDMPLPAAVSLIRDPNGNILIELPVAGTIGDPEFKLGGVVGSVIANLVLKTVTSPFSILGTVVGGFLDLFSDKGRTSAEIVFPIGEDSLDAEAKSVLEEIGEQLREHPRATLEITGTADWGEKSVLVDAWVAKAVRQRKYDGLPVAEREKATPETVLVGPEHNAREYSRLLFALYNSMPFVKNSKDPEITSPQSTRAIMRILRARVEIDENHLRVLARTRALAVYHALAQGKIDIAARLRIQESHIYDADETGGRLSSYARIQVKR